MRSTPTFAVRAAVCCGAAVLLAACGNDATGPDTTDLVGQWDYVITNATGLNVTGVCGIDDMVINFSGSGSGLTGSVTAQGTGNLECVSGSVTTRDIAGTVTLQNIAVNGSTIAFQFQYVGNAALSSTVPFVSTGSISGNGTSMSGSVTFALRFASAGGAVERPFTGSWTATRR